MASEGSQTFVIGRWEGVLQISINRIPSWARWALVLPGAFLTAVLVQFPLHWVNLLIHHFGVEKIGGETTYNTMLAAVPPDVLEYLAYSFFTPFVVISAGAYIAPNHKAKTGVALLVLMLFFYAFAGHEIALNFSAGPYNTTGGLVRLTLSATLAALGLWLGIRQARKFDREQSSEELWTTE